MGADIKHFALEQKDDNTYGWPWNEVVRKYLEAGYESENKQCELTIRDKKYQILRRDSITVFYDEKGDTLFDVTNDRLEKEYKSAISDVEEDPENDGPVSPMGKAIDAIERGAFEAATSGDKKKTKDEDLVPMGTASLADIAKGLPAPTDEEIKQAEEENAKPLKQRAKEKLEKELNDAKDKNFADPVIKYLLKRCEEDDGLSSDVLQPHKTWAKCFAYIYEQARKQRDMLLLGRRRADGNYVGKGSNIYTDGKGVTRYSPLSDWSHEAILAFIHYHKVPVPPIYEWQNGYSCGTHPWPARQWTGSVENGWKEVFEIDGRIVIDAAKTIPSAREFLEKNGK